ncbi:hypothetical protein [Nocardia pseudobrasiliensis]|uniref:Secreted protein n=1 Tax=Nocardia pseudobrasiliensis TaxID=45979 RepID=A0A370I8U1_9NOCA|nr:hypothetical protein [Nocardia pseudobrasiliensis]RDI65824.1 hypothetical protein DFR76_105140 [Nocardia pseudobrasiliensis]
MKARTLLGAAVAAVAITMTGAAVASAAPDWDNPYLVQADPADFLVGDTVYFAEYGGPSCAIHPNGDVGCDLRPGGQALWGVVPITDIAIDVPFLPAHPTFGLTGAHGRPGSRLITDVPRPPDRQYQGTRIDYGGATCIAGLPRGGMSCTSKGHTFSLGSNVQIS